jgi:hypothetical protein
MSGASSKVLLEHYLKTLKLPSAEHPAGAS